MESKAQEFLDLTALEDLKPTEIQLTKTLFKTRLLIVAREHNLTLDDFMGAARHLYITKRPKPEYVTRPHNFIERNNRDHKNVKEHPWLDHVGKAKPKAGEFPEHLRPVNDLDKRFQELVKQVFPANFLGKLGCHLLGFSQGGEPLWNNEIYIKIEFHGQEEKLNTIINQLKEELT